MIGNDGQGTVASSTAAHEPEGELRLQRVGVLELVDGDEVPLRMEQGAHVVVISNQIPRSNEEILVGDRAPDTPLFGIVQDDGAQLARYRREHIGTLACSAVDVRSRTSDHRLFDRLTGIDAIIG